MGPLDLRSRGPLPQKRKTLHVARRCTAASPTLTSGKMSTTLSRPRIGYLDGPRTMMQRILCQWALSRARQLTIEHIRPSLWPGKGGVVAVPGPASESRLEDDPLAELIAGALGGPRPRGPATCSN